LNRHETYLAACLSLPTSHFTAGSAAWAGDGTKTSAKTAITAPWQRSDDLM
jgi:hypothetical protein